MCVSKRTKKQLRRDKIGIGHSQTFFEKTHFISGATNRSCLTILSNDSHECRVMRKSAFTHEQNVRIRIILCMRSIIRAFVLQ